jgi:hypothetical protein
MLCSQQVAGLAAARGDIARRGADVTVIGSAAPEAIGGFRASTGWDGAVLVDPSCTAYRAAGLTSGIGAMLDPRGVVRAVRAFRAGFRSGRVRGNPWRQGGLFVLGPRDDVHFEWRDRFMGDSPSLDRVVAAVPPAAASPADPATTRRRT